VGIRGPVGAGKSTLVGLVLGLVAPSAGQVLVGEGLDLRRVDLAGWRSKLAWVPQRPTLFSGSVAARWSSPDEC
jgi:ABC-type multidrug transport system fused ATPase/permease subunit